MRDRHGQDCRQHADSDRMAGDTRGGGSSARRLALGRRLSVWHFLVVIALAPTLTLPVLAGELTQQRLAEASVAARIDRDMRGVESLDKLRTALTDEMTTGSLAVLAQQLKLPLAVLGNQLDLQLDTLADSRSATDRALRAVPRIDPFTTVVVGLGDELKQRRAAYDAAVAVPGRDPAILASTNPPYEKLIDLVSTTELALARYVGKGQAGITSTSLAAKTHSLAAICEVTISAGRRTGLFYVRLLSGSPSPAGTDPLVEESQRYHVLTTGLTNELDPQEALTWRHLTQNEQFRIFDATVETPDTQAGPHLATHLADGAFDYSILASVLPTARAALAVVYQLSTFLQHTADDAAAVARADAAHARQRALLATAGTTVVIAITILALFVSGGILRRRLTQLAESARRLSAGHLEPVSIRGPREVAATGLALNDAVATLRHVEAKAEILASGDLESPELEQPAPGPLGAAVHASVSRIITVIREREELRLRLAYQANHDVLTGLPNRAEIDLTLQAALGRTRDGAGPVSLLFVDLDGFKACNDRFGHAAGDHVLTTTAHRLRDAVRPGDLVGRLGGDEFVIIAEGLDAGPVTMHLGEHIVAVVSEPIDYQGQQITIGASVGLATCHDGLITADQLLSAADIAVYQAKAGGRGQVAAHQPLGNTRPTPSPAISISTATP
jgi:diguanylate cyclase (GGDEF)-like protein